MDDGVFKNAQEFMDFMDVVAVMMEPPLPVPRLKKGEQCTLSFEEYNKVVDRIGQLEAVELAARVVILVEEAGRGDSVEDLEKLQEALTQLSEALKKSGPLVAKEN